VTLDYDVSWRLRQSESVDFPLVMPSRQPEVGDLDGDGQPRVIAGTAGRSSSSTSKPPRARSPAIPDSPLERRQRSPDLDLSRIIEDLMFSGTRALSMSTAMGCRRSCRGAAGGFVHA